MGNASYNLLDYISRNFFTTNWEVEILNENTAIVKEKSSKDFLTIFCKYNDVDVYLNKKILLQLTLIKLRTGYEWVCRPEEEN